MHISLTVKKTIDDAVSNKFEVVVVEVASERCCFCFVFLFVLTTRDSILICTKKKRTKKKTHTILKKKKKINEFSVVVLAACEL